MKIEIEVEPKRWATETVSEVICRLCPPNPKPDIEETLSQEWHDEFRALDLHGFAAIRHAHWAGVLGIHNLGLITAQLLDGVIRP